MIALLVSMQVGLAQTAIVPDWPAMPDTVAGECSESVPIRVGQKVPNLLVGDSGLASCSSVCEPLSSYAQLLQIEQHAMMLEDLYHNDVTALRYERDHWQAIAERNSAVFRQPWFVAVTTSLLVTGTIVAYDSIRRDQ